MSVKELGAYKKPFIDNVDFGDKRFFTILNNKSPMQDKILFHTYYLFYFIVIF